MMATQTQRLGVPSVRSSPEVLHLPLVALQPCSLTPCGMREGRCVGGGTGVVRYLMVRYSEGIAITQVYPLWGYMLNVITCSVGLQRGRRGGHTSSDRHFSGRQKPGSAVLGWSIPAQDHCERLWGEKGRQKEIFFSICIVQIMIRLLCEDSTIVIQQVTTAVVSCIHYIQG